MVEVIGYDEKAVGVICLLFTDGAWSEAGGVNDNERNLHHSPVSSPTEELRKDKRSCDDSGRRERTRPGL